MVTLKKSEVAQSCPTLCDPMDTCSLPGSSVHGYTPTVNGKRIARNIYADSEEECEIKLESLIKEMKAEFGIR